MRRPVASTVVPGGFDKIEEAFDRALEAGLERRVVEPPVRANRLVRLREREHIRVDARAQMLQRDSERPESAIATTSGPSWRMAIDRRRA